MSEMDVEVLSMSWRTLGHRRIAAGTRRWIAVLALCLVMCVGNLAPIARAVVPTVDPGGFVALTPARVLDTRTTGGKLASGETRPVPVTGVGGVPSTNVSAVVLNVTVTETTNGGYLTVSPTGTTRPTASNLNWSGGGTTIPNAVTVKVGTGGKVDLYQSGPGTAQVIVDVAGYYMDGTVTEPGGFSSLTPARILDTRSNGGALKAAESRDLQVTGAGGVPASNVSAVVLNVTVTATTAGGYLSVYPTGTTKTTASNLNWNSAGTTIPNLVVVKVGDGGKVSLYQSGPGTAQVIADVAGYFLDGTVSQAGMYVPVSPARILDTRQSRPVAGGQTTSQTVTGRGGVPESGVAAVVMNTTVTETKTGGLLTVYPGLTAVPTASNLNWSGPNVTVPNLVTVQLGAGGSVNFLNGSPQSVQIVVDVAGYYLGVTPSAPPVTAVAAGWQHTCALVSGAVWCWGHNNHGQLGNGTTTDSATPVKVSGLSGVTALAAGGAHTCALASASGSVWCWGWNGNGQLGDGSTTDRSSPVPVSASGMTGATAIAAGWEHTCAVASESVWCWGYNTDGQLGNGSTTDRATPGKVAGLSGVLAVTAGLGHTCALSKDGSARCWGWNGQGQLGDGTTSDRYSPVVVSGLSGVGAIAAGWSHTCALVSGSARCWGSNIAGQLGDGTTIDKNTPVTVSGLTGATSVATGGGHTCAGSAQTASCWGENQAGQLGDGGITDRSYPAPVFGITSVRSVAAGGFHSCALTTAGALSCWGDNQYGQLGDGTTTDATVPVPVPVSGLG